jgi:hypothetical protein
LSGLEAFCSSYTGGDFVTSTYSPFPAMMISYERQIRIVVLHVNRLGPLGEVTKVVEAQHSSASS